MTMLREMISSIALGAAALALAVGTASAQQAGRAGEGGRLILAQKKDAPKGEKGGEAPKGEVPKGDAAAAQPAPQQLQVPPPEVLLLMIRTNIIAVDQANKTNNYTVLRTLAGPGLQALAPEKLAEHFADMRSKQIDLAPTVVVSPQLTQAPVISPEGVLQIVGYFPTQPLQVQFQIAMQPVAGFWRLAGMTINVVPPGPGNSPGAAPAPAAAAPAADAKAADKEKKK